MTIDPALDWNGVIIALIGAVGGAVVTYISTRQRAREATAALAAEQEKARRELTTQQAMATQTLIDQIQEERDAYAKQLREERAAGDARLDRMWTDKAASRQHVADLRSHINQGLGPPPPAPPAGYIE